jgi:hypothetical protein
MNVYTGGTNIEKVFPFPKSWSRIITKNLIFSSGLNTTLSLVEGKSEFSFAVEFFVVISWLSHGTVHKVGSSRPRAVPQVPYL